MPKRSALWMWTCKNQSWKHIPVVSMGIRPGQEVETHHFLLYFSSQQTAQCLHSLTYTYEHNTHTHIDKRHYLGNSMCRIRPLWALLDTWTSCGNEKKILRVCWEPNGFPRQRKSPLNALLEGYLSNEDANNQSL